MKPFSVAAEFKAIDVQRKDLLDEAVTNIMTTCHKHFYDVSVSISILVSLLFQIGYSMCCLL